MAGTWPCVPAAIPKEALPPAPVLSVHNSPPALGSSSVSVAGSSSGFAKLQQAAKLAAKVAAKEAAAAAAAATQAHQEKRGPGRPPKKPKHLGNVPSGPPKMSVPTPKGAPAKKEFQPRLAYDGAAGSAAGKRMAQAVDAAKETGNVAKAARAFHVDESSLRRRVNQVEGACAVDAKAGPTAVFDKELDDDLARYVAFIADLGFGFDWGEIQCLAKDIGRAVGHTAFTASRQWLSDFKAAHPELARRKAQYEDHVRCTAMNPKMVNHYLEKVLQEAYKFIEEKNGQDLIAAAIINLDETAIQSEPTSGRWVVCTRGTQKAKTFSGGKGIHHTLVAVIYANGDYEDMFWIVNGQKRNHEYCDDTGKVNDPRFSGHIEMSEKGYMTNDIWDIFVDWLIAKIAARRVALGLPEDYWFLLTMDGYGSHTMHPQALRKLYAAFILAICFPSHTSGHLQPLDAAVFRALKKAFDVLMPTKMRKDMMALDKWSLLIVFYEAVVRSFTVGNITSGFRCTAIFPMNLRWVEENREKFQVSILFNKDGAADAEESAAADAEDPAAAGAEGCAAADAESPAATAGFKTTIAEFNAYEAAVADVGVHSGRDLFIRARCHPWLMVEVLDISMEQAQRVVNQAWVTKMKVKKRRAADEFFTTPELSKERKAKKARRTNAIEESFAEAKLLNLEARLVTLEAHASVKEAAAAQKKERDEEKEVRNADEVFLLQAFKKLKYAKEKAKYITGTMIQAFDKNNGAVVAPLVRRDDQGRKLRAAWVDALKKVLNEDCMCNVRSKLFQGC